MIPSPNFLTNATTADGFLLVLSIVLPVMGILLVFAFGGRYVERIVLFVIPIGLGLAVAVFATIWRGGRSLVYIVGGWEPPLGIALRADGLSAAMMITVAVVIGATALFARAEFGQPREQPEARASLVFWILLLAIWAALNIIVVSDDLFNLYVALELLTFAAVPLVCLKGYEETIKAALRYLLFALFGSVLYLFGVVLIYGAYGTLDIALLAGRVRPEAVAWMAAACPCRCTGSGQRRAVGTRRQGFLLHNRTALVRRDARPDGLCRGAGARHTWRGSNSIWKRSSAAPTAAQALDRLF